jgi:hypothetical protein
MPAYIRQLGRIYIPQLPRQFHGAMELKLRDFNSCRFAASVQNSPVERRIMRNKEIDAVHHRLDPGPELPECRLVAYVFPVDTVDGGELDSSSWRPYEVCFSLCDFPVIDPYHANGASAVAPVVCGFKINCQETYHCLPVEFLLYGC